MNNYNLAQVRPALGQVPRLAPELFENGLIHFNRGNHQKAAEQFSKAIKYNPYNLDSYYNRAISHFRMERPTDACADLLYIKAQDENSMRLYLQYCK